MMTINKEINGGYVDSIGKKLRRKITISLILRKGTLYTFRLLFTPLLFLYGILLIIFLKIKLARKKNSSTLHQRAIKYVDEFVSQYPLHLYPVIMKSMELAFINSNMGKILPRVKGEISELAIGEGTLSKKIFSEEKKVIAFDLDPYNLIHTKNYKYVSKRIIADCINPPILYTPFILSNNFLNHISNKDLALYNWSRIAPYALFNENTIYWASGYSKPYLLKLFGFKKTSQKISKKIEKEGWQSLWEEKELKSLVRKYYDVIEEVTFFNEKVFFLSTIFSTLLICRGPPTPRFQKKMLNKLFRPITKYITSNVAKLLIEYDSSLPRNKDTFISWVVNSKFVKSMPNKTILICPDCRKILNSNRCSKCNRSFSEHYNMLFLLPKGLSNKILCPTNNILMFGREHL